MFPRAVRSKAYAVVRGYNTTAPVKKVSTPTSTASTRTVARKAPTTVSSGVAKAMMSHTTLEDGFPNQLDDYKPLDYEVTVKGEQVNWATSYHGIGTEAFPKEVASVLLAPLDAQDVEIKPDGILYLPEIKYRRILNRAFGPGGWGMVPRSSTINTGRSLTREYGLVCLGRLVAVSRGEQDFYSDAQLIAATEGCKSNALMRCCKDLGIASELWDPRFVRNFKKKYTEFKTPPGKLKGAWMLKSPF